jgi:succinate dehydrogenase/fumarate reductase flavoprotein subunit
VNTRANHATMRQPDNEHLEAPDPETGASTATVDVVVVGGGVAGFSTAINAAHLGLEVALIDKAPEFGGTSRKASAGMLVPNNAYMRANGLADPKPDFMRFLARVGRPLLFDPEHPTLGLPAWEHELIEAYYDNAADAFEKLEELGALHTIPQPEWSSYNEVAEDAAPFGRLLFVRRPDGTVGDGKEFLRQVTDAAEQAGVRLLRSARVVDVLIDDSGAVAGVAYTRDGGTERLAARKAVVFATGGFTHNEDLRREHLNGMYVGGCAALTSEGDFIPLAKSLGIPLHNMHSCWGAPVVFEQAVERDPHLISSFTTPGDSILTVNKHGDRVGNEKATYNDRTSTHFHWDPVPAEYPNFLLFPVWDARNTRLFARVQKPGMESAGNFIPTPDGDWRYITSADTLEDLAEGLRARLAKIAKLTGGVQLADDFVGNLTAAIARFNEFAERGVDDDYHRGEMAIERHMHGPAAPDNPLPNRTMFPISDVGPYYATILAPGAIDTKGGPKVNSRLQVLGPTDAAVPGLYGVGNCVASPSGQAYWSGGSTFGPYVTFGYLAARSILDEPHKGPPVRGIANAAN